jgi:hypothetical protein
MSRLREFAMQDCGWLRGKTGDYRCKTPTNELSQSCVAVFTLFCKWRDVKIIEILYGQPMRGTKIRRRRKSPTYTLRKVSSFGATELQSHTLDGFAGNIA